MYSVQCTVYSWAGEKITAKFHASFTNNGYMHNMQGRHRYPQWGNPVHPLHCFGLNFVTFQLTNRWKFGEVILQKVCTSVFLIHYENIGIFNIYSFSNACTTFFKNHAFVVLAQTNLVKSACFFNSAMHFFLKYKTNIRISGLINTYSIICTAFTSM